MIGYAIHFNMAVKAIKMIGCIVIGEVCTGDLEGNELRGVYRLIVESRLQLMEGAILQPGMNGLVTDPVKKEDPP